MKIHMIKHGQSRFCQESELAQFKIAGWQPADHKEQAEDEVIRLKPAVKTKATVRAVEEANELKGDE